MDNCRWVLLTGPNKGKECGKFTSWNKKYCKVHIEKGTLLDEEKDRQEEKEHVMKYGITRAEAEAERQKNIQDALNRAKEAEEKEFVEKHGMSSFDYYMKQAEEAELAKKLVEEKHLADQKAKFNDSQYCIDTFTNFVVESCQSDVVEDVFDKRIVKYDENTGVFNVGDKKYVIKVCLQES